MDHADDPVQLSSSSIYHAYSSGAIAGLDGWLTNGFCTPFQNALGPDCCTQQEVQGWTAYSGAPRNDDASGVPRNDDASVNQASAAGRWTALSFFTTASVCAITTFAFFVPVVDL